MTTALSNAIQVRPPRPAELGAARMLLPEAFSAGGAADLILAVQPEPLRFAGAASYRQVALPTGIGWNIALHVARSHRRRGVGSTLIAALVERATACRLRGLVVDVDADRGAGAGEFLQQVGFAHTGRESRYEIELQSYVHAMMPLCDRLEQRGKIPAGVFVQSLAEVPREQLLRFYAEQRGRHGDEAQSPWPAAWDAAPVREVSVALMDGSRVIGIGIGEISADRLLGHYRLIDANHRGGWANLVLCARGVSRLLERGIERAEFTTTSRTHDAQAIANLYAARLIQRRDRYLLPIPPPPRETGRP